MVALHLRRPAPAGSAAASAVRFRRSLSFVSIAALAAALGAGAAAARPGQTLELDAIEVTADTPVAGHGKSDGAAAPGMMVVPARSFAPVSVVTRADLENRLPQSVGEAVADLPGVAATGFAPGASRPVIRGLDSHRVSIQQGGVDASGVSAVGEDHGAPASPLAAERIDVIRGPATLRYGGHAIGGVVSLSDRRIPEKIPEKGREGRLLTGVTSGNRGFVAAGEVTAGARGVAVHADFFRQRSGDYDTPDGPMANSALEAWGAAIGGSFITDSGFAGLSWSRLRSRYGIPGGEEAALRSRIDMQEDRLTLRGEHRPGASWLEAVRFWAGAASYRHRELGLPHDHAGGPDHDHDHDHAGHDHDHHDRLGDHVHGHHDHAVAPAGETVHSVFYNRRQEARVEAQFAPFASAAGTWSGALGVHGFRQKLDAAGEGGGLIAPAETRAVAAYVFGELQISERWRAQLAGRAGAVEVQGSAPRFPAGYLPVPGFTEPALTPRTRNFAPKSVSAGLQYALPWHGVVATLNAQYVERAPAAPELFSKGPHHASGTFEIGDPGLKVERARTIEFSLKKADGSARFEGSVYHTRYAGFIYRRDTGAGCGHSFATCGVDDEFRQVVYDQRGARFTGAEFMGQFDLASLGAGKFGVEARYDVVHARFDDGSPVPRMPPQRVSGGVYWRSDDVFARVLLTHAFARNSTAPHETRTPGYNNLRAELNWRVKLPASGADVEEVTLGVLGDNLLDARIRNSVSFRKDEVLMPGRNVRAHLTVTF